MVSAVEAVDLAASTGGTKAQEGGSCPEEGVGATITVAYR